MMNIEEILLESEADVKFAIARCTAKADTVIARYTAAFAVNFTDWIGKTIPWVRHEKARYALIDNLRCESVEDHIEMLYEFSSECGAFPELEHFRHTWSEVNGIRKLFCDPNEAGLLGLTVLTILENTSTIFIPDLAERAKRLGCKVFTYTDKHGEADAEHSTAFREALKAEVKMGYPEWENLVLKAKGRAVNLIGQIYE